MLFFSRVKNMICARARASRLMAIISDENYAYLVFYLLYLSKIIFHLIFIRVNYNVWCIFKYFEMYFFEF